MKKSSVLFFVIVIATFKMSLAQSRLIWTSPSAFPNSQITEVKSFAADHSGNSYSINFTQSTVSSYITDVFYAHDASGLKLWEYSNDSCLTDCNDKYYNIVPIDNNGAIFIGEFEDLTGTQLRIKRIDASGSLLWEQFWISPFLSVKPIQSLLDNTGHLIVGLSAITTIADQEDFAIAKFDTSNGFLDWHIELPDDGSGSNSLSEVISSIAVDASNNIYGVGTGSDASSGVTKNYFFRLDDNGSIDYRLESSYSGMGSSNHSIQLDNVGNMYTLGFGGSRPVIEKRRVSSGNLIWSTGITKDTAVLFNVGFSVIDDAIYTLNNYTYFIPDTSFAGGHWENRHYAITKLDTSGATFWQYEYLTSVDSLALQADQGGAVQFSACNDNLYVLSNQFVDSVNNVLFLHSVDLSGTTLWYDTASAKNEAGYFAFDDQCEIYLSRTFDNYNLTEKYTSAPANSIASLQTENVFEIYPNPATNEFSISFTNKTNSKGVIIIYNSFGEIVKRESTSGAKKNVSIAELLSGFYFVQFVSDKNEIFTKRLLKID